MTIKELFDLAEESGANLGQVILRDKDDEPIRAVVAVIGKPETAEFLEIVNRWYDRIKAEETEEPTQAREAEGHP